MRRAVAFCHDHMSCQSQMPTLAPRLKHILSRSGFVINGAGNKLQNCQVCVTLYVGGAAPWDSMTDDDVCTAEAYTIACLVLCDIALSCSSFFCLFWLPLLLDLLAPDALSVFCCNQASSCGTHGFVLDGQASTCSGNTVAGCTTTANGQVGVAQNHCPGNAITSNTASGNGNEGITADNQSDGGEVSA